MNALRKWRNPARLSLGRQDPLFLPATPDPSDSRIVWYSDDDVVAFLRRNSNYAEVVFSCLVPEHIHMSFIERIHP